MIFVLVTFVRIRIIYTVKNPILTKESREVKTSGGMFLLCGVSSVSDWLPGYEHHDPAPLRWPIRSQNCGRGALRNSDWCGRRCAVPSLHPPIRWPFYGVRQEHPSKNLACLLSFWTQFCEGLWFFFAKNFCTQIFLPNFFGTKIFGTKNFLTWIFFQSIFFWTITFWPNIFRTKHFWTKIFLT